MPGHWYTWQPPAGYEPKGEHLARLLAFFDNPEREEDRALIKALFLLPAWGGPYGSRPAFVLEAPDRRCGKSTLADMAGLLYGGALDFDLTRKGEEDLATRLLSAGGLTKRIVRVDNVKRSLSSGIVEGLITSVEISGKVLFHGEGSRPNSLVWILTANGLRLSRDMAERCFLIRLRQPEMRADWRETVMGYVATHRACILADIVATLKAPALPTDATDRWAEFVRHVLARSVTDPAAVAQIVTLNQERRNAHDDDLEEAETLQDAIDEELRTAALPGQMIFWTSEHMTEIVNRALHLDLSSRKVGHFLKAHLEAGRLPCVVKYRTATQKGWHVTRPETKEGTP